MTRIAALALIVASFAYVAPSYAADPSGLWLVQDGDAQVRMVKCGPGYCGTLAWLRDAKDAKTGKPVTDEKNPDPAKRNRPLLGTMIAISFVPAPDAPNTWNGHFYNADDGSTYSGSISPTSATEMAVKGCLLMFCQTQTWRRVGR